MLDQKQENEAFHVVDKVHCRGLSVFYLLQSHVVPSLATEIMPIVVTMECQLKRKAASFLFIDGWAESSYWSAFSLNSGLKWFAYG